MIDYLEIKFWGVAKYLIRRQYGLDCDTSDLEDWPEKVIHRVRCPSCRAREVVDWIDENIKLIKL